MGRADEVAHLDLEGRAVGVHVDGPGQLEQRVALAPVDVDAHVQTRVAGQDGEGLGRRRGAERAARDDARAAVGLDQRGDPAAVVDGQPQEAVIDDEPAGLFACLNRSPRRTRRRSRPRPCRSAWSPVRGLYPDAARDRAGVSCGEGGYAAAGQGRGVERDDAGAVAGEEALGLVDQGVQLVGDAREALAHLLVDPGDAGAGQDVVELVQADLAPELAEARERVLHEAADGGGRAPQLGLAQQVLAAAVARLDGRDRGERAAVRLEIQLADPDAGRLVLGLRAGEELGRRLDPDPRRTLQVGRPRRLGEHLAGGAATPSHQNEWCGKSSTWFQEIFCVRNHCAPASFASCGSAPE